MSPKERRELNLLKFISTFTCGCKKSQIHRRYDYVGVPVLRKIINSMVRNKVLVSMVEKGPAGPRATVYALTTLGDTRLAELLLKRLSNV